MGSFSDPDSSPRIPEAGPEERAMLREFASVLRRYKVRSPVARSGLDAVVTSLEQLAQAPAD